MIDATTMKIILNNILTALLENKELLTELDSEAGDGDLGISMEQGFKAVVAFVEDSDETDLGKLLIKLGMTLNEASPSTLGTILSVGMISGGKALRGVTTVDVTEAALFFQEGNRSIMERSKSKPGEKTVMDVLIPVEQAFLQGKANGLSWKDAVQTAAQAAVQGCEDTKKMRAVHGRAAYYAEKSIGRQDGGATVAKIIMEALASTV